MSTTVQSGPFRFCTVGQLDLIRLEFAATGSSFNDRLTGSSQNGQSFQFGGREYTREEFGDHLAAAYCSLGITQYGEPASRRSVIRFG